MSWGEKVLRLPVDIEALAHGLGIGIGEEDLNGNPCAAFHALNRNIGQLSLREDSYTKEKRAAIHVDGLAPPPSRRFAVAHGIAHYLLHYQDTRYYGNFYIVPLCPVKMEELAVDVFSVFLLIPLRAFFRELCGYTSSRSGGRDVPISTEEWLRHLSERAVLPGYHAAYGYQYLRMAACRVRQAWDADGKQGSGEGMSEEERRETVEWTAGYYDRTHEKWIFQT